MFGTQPCACRNYGIYCKFHVAAYAEYAPLVGCLDIRFVASIKADGILGVHPNRIVVDDLGYLVPYVYGFCFGIDATCMVGYRISHGIRSRCQVHHAGGAAGCICQVSIGLLSGMQRPTTVLLGRSRHSDEKIRLQLVLIGKAESV